MSLQLAAQHMASRGRGPDTQLVHMAPQEVAGLHALAKAHGGSLTINPDTGLPEAGFLSSILPMVIGAGLSIASGGALTPLMAAGITGAGYGVATGSLSKGLMAGLGAYGGAGLMGGLAGAGTGALSSAAGSAAANSVVPTVATEAAAPALLEGAGSAAANMSASPAYDVLSGGFNAFDPGLGVNVASPINAGQMVAQANPTITQAPVLSQQAADIGNAYAQEQAAQNAVAQKLGSATSMDTIKAGLGEIGSDPKRFMTMDNLKYGLAGLSPMMMQEPKGLEKPKEYKARDYDFSYNRVADPEAAYTGAYTGQRTYFNPTFTERTAAGGGLMDLGPVETMSNQNQANTLMANGGQMFAEGGETKAVKPVEQNPYYTMSGQSGDAYKYLMGQMPAPTSAAPAPAPAPVTAAPAQATPAASVSGFLSSLRRALKTPLADSGRKSYTFDPVTGAMTQVPTAESADFAPSAAYTPFIGGGSGAGLGGSDGMAHGGIASLAQGGQSHLGDYSDGGRLLKGPGDGVSDSIPATIANKRPARLADGEFVVPARIVSELGNGSTEAGARKLYAMMDRVQNARKKSIGKNRVAVNSRSEKLLPA